MVEPLKRSLKSCYSLIHRTFQEALSKTFADVSEKIIITPSSNAKFDYQCPSAVRLFNSYKKDGEAFGVKSAKEMAAKILSAMDLNASPVIEKVDLNEAGFLSIKVKDSFAEDFVNSVLRDGPGYLTANPQIIVVDFSSPNIAKEMHVGHMRSTIIGESICRILEFMGNKVHRVNHVGDWGTQFGMLISYMQKVYPDYLEKMPPLKDLQSFYKASKNEFDKDPEFKKLSQQTVVRLQAGESDCIKAWQIICEVSRQDFLKIYKRLHINLEEFGESYYNSRIPAVIKECEDRGIVQMSEGAKCIFVEGFTNPIMIQKSDGGFNYDSTDMAAVRYRLLELKAERIIYITDSGQETHFLAIFEAAKLMGWHLPPKTRLDHMGFGVILGSDGKRFKTRSGDTVKLMDLLDEAFANCKKDLVKRLNDSKEGNTTNLVEEEIDEAAEKIGMAALKYFDLKQTRQTDYKFEYDKMLDLKGNTAVYLIYSYVRLCSILRKSGLNEQQIEELIQKEGFKFTHPQEKIIANTLMRFPETLDTVVDELAIHKLCDFIYAISTKIAEGYNKYRIIDDPNKNSRILLCEAARRVMKEALYMVGIVPVEKI